MKLRARLALTVVAVAIPVLVGLIFLNRYFIRRATDAAFVEFARAQMQSSREQCERAPSTWILGGPPDGPRRPPFDGPPPPFPPLDGEPPEPPPPLGPPRLGPPSTPAQLFAYDASFTSANPDAPKLSAHLIEALQRGADTAFEERHGEGPPLQQLLVRMSWSAGPCAIVLARRHSMAELMPMLMGPPIAISLLAMFVVLGVVLLGVGPLVRRIRLLTVAVQGSASAGYPARMPLEGSDEIAELARAFEKAGDDVKAHLAVREERERTLRSFLENTTHDVMIPLTVLQGHLAALAAGGPLDAATVKSAMNEAHYMASLMHNLGVAAKLEAGDPQLQRAPVDLNALVARAAGRHQPIAKQRGIALETAVPEAPLFTIGDVTLMEQALSNVVYNAIRYNKEGGHVAVLLTSEAATLQFRLRVLDDGPGIAEADRARITERYFRGNEARTRDPEGRGLGLNIAFQVAKRHGWELKLGPSEYGGLQVDFSGATAPAPASSK